MALLCLDEKHYNWWLSAILKWQQHTSTASVSQRVRKRERCLFETPKSSIGYLFFWLCGLLQWLAQPYQNKHRKPRMAFSRYLRTILARANGSFLSNTFYQDVMFFRPSRFLNQIYALLALLPNSSGYFCHIKIHRRCHNGLWASKTIEPETMASFSQINYTQAYVFFFGFSTSSNISSTVLNSDVPCSKSWWKTSMRVWSSLPKTARSAHMIWLGYHFNTV